MDIVHHLQILQIVLSGIVGFIGVGIGIGVFRNSIRQLSLDIADIKRKQSNLRGENGNLPLFMTRLTCNQYRDVCGKMSERTLQKMCDDISSHTDSIKAFDNFARWWMQKEGLTIEQANHILSGK